MLMGVSAEQQELREAVRRFLSERAPLPRVRELMETDHGTDPEVWRQAGTQLGLQGIAIPEEYGGSRLSLSPPAIPVAGLGPAARNGPGPARAPPPAPAPPAPP